MFSNQRLLLCLAVFYSIGKAKCLPNPHLTATRVTAKSFGLGGLGAGYSAGIGFGLYGGRYNTYASGFGYNPLARPPAVYAGVHPFHTGTAAAYQQTYPAFGGGLHAAPVAGGYAQPLPPPNGGFVNGNHHAQYSQFQSGYYGSSGNLGYGGVGSSLPALQTHHYS